VDWATGPLFVFSTATLAVILVCWKRSNPKMKRTYFFLFSIFTVLNPFCAACLQSNASSLPIQSIPNGISGYPECTKIGQTWVSPIDGVTLICVPAGEFLMGAATGDLLAMDDEKPQHQVYLDAYWFDRTEVTNFNFGKCLAAGACHPKVYDTNATTFVPYAIHLDYQDYPALLYEFEPAAEYCQWAGRQLPTEAQWEKAARGTDARLYTWGNAPLDCTLANYLACDIVKNTDSTAPRCGYSKYCKTTQVGDYLTGASPYGALNMAGNVWEWVADWYQPDYYANSPMNNPSGPTDGDHKVIRGGGAKSLSQELRATNRASGAPQHFMDGQMGFRCAMNPDSP
jgi:formylglycine-generating enzyme required for sulfatase activity